MCLLIQLVVISVNKGLSFLLICLAGNLINVLMEEGIFRGLFQKYLKRNTAFEGIFVQSSFGFWHIMGPFRSFLDGK